MDTADNDTNHNSAAAHTERATVLLAENRGAEAIEHCERAISLDPDYFAAYRILGCAWMRLENFAQAIGAFGAALRVEPASAGLHAMLGLSLARDGRIEDGERELQAAILLDPSNIHHKRALGTVRLMKQPYPNSEENLKELLKLELHPIQRFTVLLDLAKVLTAGGSWADAEAVLDRAEEVASSLGNAVMTRLASQRRHHLERLRRMEQTSTRLGGLLAELQPLCDEDLDHEVGADTDGVEERRLKLARAIESELVNLRNLGDDTAPLKTGRRRGESLGGDQPPERETR